MTVSDLLTVETDGIEFDADSAGDGHVGGGGAVAFGHPADAARTRRATEEPMVVVPDRDADAATATGMYDVVTTGGVYAVDALDGGACECPDWVHSPGARPCKHVRRVALAVASGHCPAAGERAAAWCDALAAADLLDATPDDLRALVEADDEGEGDEADDEDDAADDDRSAGVAAATGGP